MDIHESEKRFKSILSRILSSRKISKRNKELINKFQRDCFAEGLSCIRIERYMYMLRNLVVWLRKDLDKVDKEDLLDLVQKIERMDYADWTKKMFKIALKKFYKWNNGGEEYPEMVKWLKTTMKKEKSRLPEEILTVEEVKRMIEEADNARDKALIAILYESGCRVGELAGLQIKHVAFDKFGSKVLLNGKTGMRKVRLITSTPYLASWIEMHPLNNDYDATLWINLGTTNNKKIMRYRNIAKMLKVIAKRAGIKKRVNPHSFRHARATHLANYLTEAQMKVYFGWVQNSDMAGIYVHLSGRDVDNAIMKLNGIKVDEEEERKNGNDAMKPIVCVRCATTNGATSQFCNKCGAVLDLKIAIEMDESRARTDKMMNHLIKDPEVLEILQKKVAELRT